MVVLVTPDFPQPAWINAGTSQSSARRGSECRVRACRPGTIKAQGCHRQRAAQVHAPVQEVTALGRMKRHRQISPDACRQDTPAVGAEPARDVHRNDPEGPSVARLFATASVSGEAAPAFQFIAERRPERSAQPGSEESIDQQVGTWPGLEGDIGVACPQARLGSGKLAPFLVIRLRVRRQLPGRAKERSLDLPAPFLQQPCHDKPVAAVVAGAAKHVRATRRSGQIRPFLEDRLHYAPAGPFHEFKPRDLPARHGGLLNGSHFVGGQNGGHDRASRNGSCSALGRSSSGISPLR